MTAILPSCLLIFTFASQAHSHLTALRKSEYEDKEIPALLNWKGFVASKKKNETRDWYWPKNPEDLLGDENDRSTRIENRMRIGLRSLDNSRFEPSSANPTGDTIKPVGQLGFLEGIPCLGADVRGIILQQENGNFAKSPFQFAIKETNPLTLNYPNVNQAKDKKLNSNDHKKYCKDEKEYYESSVDNQALLNQNLKKSQPTLEPNFSDDFSTGYQLEGPSTDRFNEKKVLETVESNACNSSMRNIEITPAPVTTSSYEIRTPAVSNAIQNIFVLVVNYNDSCGTQKTGENQIKPHEDGENKQNLTACLTTANPPTESYDYIDATTPDRGETSTFTVDQTTCNLMKKKHNNPKVPQRKPSTKLPEKFVKYQLLNKPTQKSFLVPFMTKHLLWNYPLNNNEMSIELPKNSTGKNVPLIINHRKAKSTNLLRVRDGRMPYIPNEESHNSIQDLQDRLSIYSMHKMWKRRKGENQNHLRPRDFFNSRALEWKRLKSALPLFPYKNSQIKAKSEHLRELSNHGSLADSNTQTSSAKFDNLDPKPAKFNPENSISVDDLINDRQSFSSESFSSGKVGESEFGDFAYGGDGVPGDDSAWTLEQEEQANYPQRVAKDLKTQTAPVQDSWEELDKILRDDFVKRQSEGDSEDSKTGAFSTLASYFHWLGSDH